MDKATFTNGQQVTYCGNNDCYVQEEGPEGMFTVRVWSGRRLVGDVCVSANELKAVTQADAIPAR